MVKKLIFLMVISIAVSGCATFRRDQSMVTQLQMRVGELERDIQAKDQRINELEYNVKDISYDIKQLKEKASAARAVRSKTTSTRKFSSKKDGRIIRVDVDPKTVQQALKNAGYYSAAIDGNVGSGTKKAIYQFQKDNDLKADGLIGQQTWEALKGFLGE